MGPRKLPQRNPKYTFSPGLSHDFLTIATAVPPPESYILLVRLNGIDDPAITRLLSVPTTFTFAKLHDVLQAAFGWANCHMHTFSVSKLLEEDEEPNFMTGSGQEVLSLSTDPHMAVDMDDAEHYKQTSDFTLADIYEGPEYEGKVEVTYEYDMGDGWNHSIVFLGKAHPSMRKAMHIPDEMAVVCLSGEGHPCAEDAGGPGGWDDLKDAFKKKGDKDGRKDWYKNACTNGDPKGLDPYKWDIGCQ